MRTHTTDIYRVGSYDDELVMKYAGLTNEKLIRVIAETGSDAAYAQLYRNLKPIILHESKKYYDEMDIYDRDDFLQEGMILLWQIIERGTFKGTAFAIYYKAALKKRLITLYRSYTLNNLVCVREIEDVRGNLTRILVESEYAKVVREKRRESCRRWREKQKAMQPPKPPKPPLDEKRAARAAYCKAYRAAHPEKCRMYAERKRERKLAAKKAASAEAGC